MNASRIYAMKIFDTILKIISLVSALVFVIGVGLCYWNQSGHTSFNPSWGLYFFASVFVMGLIIRARLWQQRVLTHVVISSGLCGMILILLVTHLDIVDHYENWVAKGMPERHPHANFFLIGLLLAYLAGTMIWTYAIQAKNHT